MEQLFIWILSAFLTGFLDLLVITAISFLLVELPYLIYLVLPTLTAKAKKYDKDVTIPENVKKFMDSYGTFTYRVIPSYRAFAYVNKNNIITISSYLLTQFKFEDYKYILVHEMGHIRLGHIERRKKLMTIFFFCSIFLLGLIQPPFWLTLVLGLVAAIPLFMIQRADEDAADRYAVSQLGIRSVIHSIEMLQSPESFGIASLFLKRFMFHRFDQPHIKYLKEHCYTDIRLAGMATHEKADPEFTSKLEKALQENGFWLSRVDSVKEVISINEWEITNRAQEFHKILQAFGLQIS